MTREAPVGTNASDVEKFFASDLEGLYKQHDSMWTIYSESIKILVTLTSLPFLASAVFIGNEGFQLTLDNIPQALRLILFVTPVLDIFMIGVVINYRLVVILYARAINGYRGLFLETSKEQQDRFKNHVRLPTTNDVPGFYEPVGPMGVIVHGIALVGAGYLLVGLWILSRWFWILIPIAYMALVETLYFANCRKYERKGPGREVAETAL